MPAPARGLPQSRPRPSPPTKFVPSSRYPFPAKIVQPKLFQASRQDDHCFSDCTVSVIQILDDADAAFRILGAELRTVLSATTMFADKPHSL
jgi:hypothetical protein